MVSAAHPQAILLGLYDANVLPSLINPCRAVKSISYGLLWSPPFCPFFLLPTHTHTLSAITAAEMPALHFRRYLGGCLVRRKERKGWDKSNMKVPFKWCWHSNAEVGPGTVCWRLYEGRHAEKYALPLFLMHRPFWGGFGVVPRTSIPQIRRGTYNHKMKFDKKHHSEQKPLLHWGRNEDLFSLPTNPP